MIPAAASQARRWISGVRRRPSGTATMAPSPSWSVFERRMVMRRPRSCQARSADIEGDEFGAAGGERHAEGDQRAVAQRREGVALDGPE